MIVSPPISDTQVFIVCVHHIKSNGVPTPRHTKTQGGGGRRGVKGKGKGKGKVTYVNFAFGKKGVAAPYSGFVAEGGVSDFIFGVEEVSELLAEVIYLSGLLSFFSFFWF